MSPVTGLDRLPGQILFSVHMENFSPVTGTKQNMVPHKILSLAGLS